MDFHQPVLLNETISLLNVLPKHVYIDCTVGNGGHTLEIIKKGGIVHGIENDPINFEIVNKRIIKTGYKSRFYPHFLNFRDLQQVIESIKLPISGILFDLGLSSNQYQMTGRGFSFNDSQSLDMRLNPSILKPTAENIINTYSYKELYNIFTKIVQERNSQTIVNKIITERKKQPIRTSQSLKHIIHQAVGYKHQKTRTDPATKIFLGLRIIVNNEIDNLRKALLTTINNKLHDCIVCIITFHSTEDRLVKKLIRQFVQEHKIINLTPKVIVPCQSEIENNPLSRSAKLRCYKII